MKTILIIFIIFSPFFLLVLFINFLFNFYFLDFQGLKIVQIFKVDKKNRSCLNILIENRMLLEIADIYEPLYKVLMLNNEFKDWITPNGGIMITTAFDEIFLLQIQMHSNIYIDSKTTLKDFLKYSSLNREYLNIRNWSYKFYPPFLLVKVWDINSKVKKPINLNRRFYHSDFTPLKFKSKPLTPIGAMDIETFKNNVGKQSPLLITCSYLDDNQKIRSFYSLLDLTKNNPIKTMLKLFIKQLIDNVKSGTVIFIHNLGDFDGYILIKFLLIYKLIEKNNVNTLIDKEHRFIQIKLTFERGGCKATYILKDSLRIFNISLEELGEVFDSTYKKKGKYQKSWNDLSILNNTEKLREFISYAKSDSLALLDIMLQAQKYHWENYNVDIATILSSSTLSLKIYRTNFQKTTIPSLSKILDFYIRKSYYGGSTDIYQKYGENLYYYDVNSLYSKAMLKPLPLKPLPFEPDLWNSKLEDFYGFAFCWINCPKNIKIPLLPFRKESGEIIFPTGEWTGWYFSEILKAVVEKGYIVKLIKGIPFTKTTFFDSYIDHFYNLKKNYKTQAERILAKDRLNYIYGYFGRSNELIETKIVDDDQLFELLKTRVVTSVIDIEGSDLYFVLLTTNLNKQIMSNLNIELPNLINVNKNVKSNVAIASAITAYASIEMMKYKDDNSFYTDTDSIFTSKSLPTGIELGDLKDELKGFKISRALFLSTKMYIYEYKNKDNKIKTISVCSGVKRNTLTWDQFVQISQGGSVTITRTDVFHKSLRDLSITIKDRETIVKYRNDKELKNNRYLAPNIHQVKNKYLQNYWVKIINTIKRLLKIFKYLVYLK
jgi:hypothetical protein